MTPFQVVYGREPPKFQNYHKGSATMEAADIALQDRDSVLMELRTRLLQAQVKMKNNYDAHHRDVQFQINNLMLLKLHPYRQKSLRQN